MSISQLSDKKGKYNKSQRYTRVLVILKPILYYFLNMTILIFELIEVSFMS